jgi:hypothetical protein
MKRLTILVAVLGIILGLWPIVSGMFPVTFDQGRDWLWVKNQFDLGRPSLVGPAGSIRGVFFGPLWFWLLAIPYGLSGGSPMAMTLFNALLVYAAVVLAALIFKKHDQKLFWLIILLGFGSPALHGLANHAFSQHLLPLLTVLLFYSLVKGKFVWACLWVSLMWHAEPPMSVFSLPLLVYAGWKGKIKLKTILLGAIVFLVPFLPLLVFDWRHDWLQLRSLLDFLSGNTRGLQEIRPLSLWERLLDRPQKFWTALSQSVGPVMAVLTMVMVVFRRQKFNQFVTQWLKLSWMYLGMLALIFVVYPHDLKLFYFEGLRLLLIIIAAASFKKLPLWLSIILVLINLVQMRPNRMFKSLYVNQIEAIDRIYEDASGEGFRVYTFVPAIYDYNWQYLWLWRGLGKYGYLPADFSYWPDVPEYVPYKDAALVRLSDKIKPAGKFVYTIITTGSVQERESWLNRFDNFNWQFVSQYWLPDATMINKFEAQ